MRDSLSMVGSLAEHNASDLSSGARTPNDSVALCSSECSASILVVQVGRLRSGEVEQFPSWRLADKELKCGF